MRIEDFTEAFLFWLRRRSRNVQRPAIEMSLTALDAEQMLQSLEIGDEQNIVVTAATGVTSQVSSVRVEQTTKDRDDVHSASTQDRVCKRRLLASVGEGPCRVATYSDRPSPDDQGPSSGCQCSDQPASANLAPGPYSDRPPPDHFAPDEQASSFGSKCSDRIAPANLAPGTALASFKHKMLALESFKSCASHTDSGLAMMQSHALVDSPGKKQTRPTRVSVKILIDKWEMTVQDHQEVMNLKVTLRCSWTDPRLRGFPLDRPMPPDIWRPEIICDSSTGLTLSKDSVSSMPVFFDKDRDGRVLWEVSTNLEKIPLLFNHKEALKVFPFDSHRFDFVFHFGGDGSNRLDSNRDVAVCFDMQQINVITNFTQRRHSLVRPDDVAFSSPSFSGDFTMETLSYGVGTCVSVQTGLQNDCVCLSLHVARDPSFVIYKGVVPLVSIFFLATLSFAIDIQLLSDRLNYIMTLFLTIVAIQWTITDRLPRVPYLTLIDRLLIITLCTLLLMAAGSVVCHRLIFPWRLGPTTEGNIEAGSIDAAALSASTNPLGQYLDAGVLSVSCLLFLAHSVHIVWRKRSKGSGMRRPWTAGTHPHNKRSLV